jgi:hypothetical protein
MNRRVIHPHRIDKDLFPLAVLRTMRLLPDMSSAKVRTRRSMPECMRLAVIVENDELLAATLAVLPKFVALVVPTAVACPGVSWTGAVRPGVFNLDS